MPKIPTRTLILAFVGVCVLIVALYLAATFAGSNPITTNQDSQAANSPATTPSSSSAPGDTMPSPAHSTSPSPAAPKPGAQPSKTPGNPAAPSTSPSTGGQSSPPPSASPSSSPTPPSERSCPAFPAFPNASCTGVPAGTALTTRSGDLVITQNGASVNQMNILGSLIINANNVTVSKSKITGGIRGSGTGATITDVELGPATGQGGDNGIGMGGYSCTRCNIHNFSDGVKVYGGEVITDSYIHDLWFTPGDHNDGIQAFMGNGNITIRHNYISSAAQDQSGQNGAIQMADGWLGTATIENNLFDSYGVYALRLHENGTYAVRNNRWTRNAPNTHTLLYGIVQAWSGNAYQDNGQAIAQ